MSTSTYFEVNIFPVEVNLFPVEVNLLGDGVNLSDCLDLSGGSGAN